MEYTALYRRFRPLTFEGILGQNHITTTLKNQVIANRVGHAYLFTGCRGCGKTSSAKVLARAINCLNPRNGEPCNECDVCKAALDGSLTDIVEMDAASNNSVDNIRAIREEVNFLPTVAKYRIYIIDEVHMLSTGAFNALLKTLEEPPKHVKFILATTEPQKLPATILSRCQRFDFKKISENKIVDNLKKICEECKITFTIGALNLIAELSEGAMRDALSILERCAQDGENNISEEKIKELVGIPESEFISNIISQIVLYNAEFAFQITEQIINESKDVNSFLWEMVKYCRDLMLLKTTQNVSNIYNENDITKMKKILENIDTERLLNIIYSLSKLENDTKSSSQKNIVFQVGILKLCGKESNTLEKRVEELERKIKEGNIAVESNITKDMNASSKNEKRKMLSYLSTNSETKVDKSNQNSKDNLKTENKPKLSLSATDAPFWGKVINTLKEQRQPMLYSNLLNTRGVILDDLTFGIEFPNGLNSFGKSVIEKPENMAELKRLVSIECKKDMRIKLLNNNGSQNNSNKVDNNLALGININMID